MRQQVARGFLRHGGGGRDAGRAGGRSSGVMSKGSNAMRAVLLAGALLIAGGGAPVMADEVRDAARAQASAIREAWAALAGWITRDPRGQPLEFASDVDEAEDERAPWEWLDGVASNGLPNAVWHSDLSKPPPVWKQSWTDRGLSFRYCEDVLAVYADSEELRGTDQRTVQVEGGLQWTTASGLEGSPQKGYQEVTTLPACMSLPADRVALVGVVLDPFGWRNTKRRNTTVRWELACTDGRVKGQTYEQGPGGSNIEITDEISVGEVQFRQTVPVELHPWTGADMARWPEDCHERMNGEFEYADTHQPGVTERVIPDAYPDGAPFAWHGQCDPANPSGSADDKGGTLKALSSPAGPKLYEDDHLLPDGNAINIADAAIYVGCKKQVKIEDLSEDAPEKHHVSPRWHFYDTLCREAVDGPTAAVDGGASSYQVPISERADGADPAPFFKEDKTIKGSQTWLPPKGGYASTGEPYPTPSKPDIPACARQSYCPAPYDNGGAIGTRLEVRKHRFVWKEDKAGWDGASAPGVWTEETDPPAALYDEPGAAAEGNPGVFQGDTFIQEDFSACYDIEVRDCSGCGADETGVGYEYWQIFHPHSPLGTVGPHAQSQCRCVSNTVYDESQSANGGDDNHGC